MTTSANKARGTAAFTVGFNESHLGIIVSIDVRRGDEVDGYLVPLDADQAHTFLYGIRKALDGETTPHPVNGDCDRWPQLAVSWDTVEAKVALWLREWPDADWLLIVLLPDVVDELVGQLHRATDDRDALRAQLDALGDADPDDFA